MAALLWHVGFTALLTRQYAIQNASSPIQVTPAIMTLSYLVLICMLAMIIAAYPRIRFILHNYFELTHRFRGWTVVALFWPLLLLFAMQAAGNGQVHLSNFLVTFPPFWMLIITTVAIIHPWVLLRRVSVRPECLSSHAIRLHFDHTIINFGHGLSVSKQPVRDWHSFATFPDVPSVKGTSGSMAEHPEFSMLVSKAGDRTADTIARPPTHLWKRAVPIYGFGYVMKVFRRVVLVTTGSGIGPCLSFTGDPDRPQCESYGRRGHPLIRTVDRSWTSSSNLIPTQRYWTAASLERESICCRWFCSSHGNLMLRRWP